MTVSILPMNVRIDKEDSDNLTSLDAFDYVSDYDKGLMAERELVNEYLVWKAQQN